jgi:large subunit ribosomal protein L13
MQQGRTTLIKPAQVAKRWVLVNAEGEVLGRLASRLAAYLRGKHHVNRTPHVDAGDVVVVVNAAKIRLTGRKLDQKFLKRYSGYPGGLKLVPYRRLMETRPAHALRRAVWGMLPHGRQGRRLIRALKVYPGPEHRHAAQKPVPLVLKAGRA